MAVNAPKLRTASRGEERKERKPMIVVTVASTIGRAICETSTRTAEGCSASASPGAGPRIC